MHKPECIQDHHPKRKSILINFLTFNRVVYVISLSQIADISWRVAYKKDQDDSQKDHGQVILLFPPGLRTVIQKWEFNSEIILELNQYLLFSFMWSASDTDKKEDKVVIISSSWCCFQKMNKWIRLYYYDTSGRLVFVRFLEEIEDTKKTFRN